VLCYAVNIPETWQAVSFYYKEVKEADPTSFKSMLIPVQYTPSLTLPLSHSPTLPLSRFFCSDIDSFCTNERLQFTVLLALDIDTREEEYSSVPTKQEKVSFFSTADGTLNCVSPYSPLVFVGETQYHY
jgi:hypothetical protein